MKKLLSIALLALLTFSSGLSAAAEGDLEQHPSCDYCGMNRSKFAHSRMLIEYADGSSAALCSLHCSAIEFAVRIDKTPQAILVADYNRHQLIDAGQAVWLLGGDQPGVMTSRAKWAFADRSAAELFQQQQGGSLSNFSAAMKASYEDMYQDTQMIRKKRHAKRLKLSQPPLSSEPH